MNYDVIYLQPANPSGERLWCQDDNPDGGGGWVKYVRADSEAIRLARVALGKALVSDVPSIKLAAAAALAALGGGNG